MSNILIIAEHAGGNVKKYSFELVSKAAELAGKTGGEVHAIIFGEGIKNAADLGKYGAKKVTVVENPALKFYSAGGYAKVIADLVNTTKPTIILGSASPVGKDLLPKVAAKLKVGFTQDCVELDIVDGKLKVKRPVFAGKALIDFTYEGSPQVATARPNSFPIKETGGTAQVEKIAGDPGTIKAIVKELKEVEKGETDVAEADIVVSGGRAMGNAEGFKVIYDLAHSIPGAAVGASRAAVDAGYISHDHQVGQTGKVVNPKLYIAAGISGAIQHLAGMRTSKVIVAINKDPEAPIFTKADFGIVGDLFKIVPILTEKLKKALKE